MDQPRSVTPTPGKIPSTMTGSHSRVWSSSLWQWIPWGRQPKSLKVISQLVLRGAGKEESVTVRRLRLWPWCIILIRQNTVIKSRMHSFVNP